MLYYCTNHKYGYTYVLGGGHTCRCSGSISISVSSDSSDTWGTSCAVRDLNPALNAMPVFPPVINYLFNSRQKPFKVYINTLLPVMIP